MISWLFDSLAPFVQLLLVSVGLYLAPGLAILGIAWPLAARPLRGAERFALAIGISLALPPVLLYAFRLLGLTWSATATQLYVAIAVLVWLVPMIRDRARRPHPHSLFSLSRHWVSVAAHRHHHVCIGHSAVCRARFALACLAIPCTTP